MGQIITNLDNIVTEAIGPIVTSNVNVIAAQQAVVDAQVLAGVAEDEADAAIAARVATETVAADVAVLKADTIVVKDTAVAAKDVAVAKAAETEAIRAATQVLKDRSQELRDDALDYLVRMEVRYDEFDDRFLGGYGEDPLVDNDGDQIRDGALFWNTTEKALKIYDGTASRWKSMFESSGALLAVDNLADLLDKNAARTNLDVYAKSEVTEITGAISAQVDTNTANISAMDTLLDAHLLDNGSAHSYINQDVTTTGTPRFNSVQLNGGVGTQGLMTWNANEETVDIVQNGAVLQVGQEMQTHVRNGTASTIASGTVAMATGTVGVSGRVTAAPYDNVADVKYVLGVVTEDIVAGDDGKVTHFGKVRGVNTDTWNEGDVLYTAAAGGLTNVVPTSGKKLAVAFVVTKHAVNGTIMVRVNGVDELAYEPKNANIQSHIASTSNPHSVTKAQVGLGSVDNTSDAMKNVLSATKLTTPRAITLTGDVTGTVNFDGSAGVSITATVVDNNHNHVINNVDGLQTALDAKVDDTEKGAANGVATLDANGKVVLSQINDSILGQLEYQGVWDFTTIPTATEKGQYWVCSVAGNGYAVGDWAVYNGSTFDKVDNTDAVSSVAGRTGVVTLTKSDVGLSNVDNTSDATKKVLSATKLTTARAIQLSGAVTGTADFDGSAAINIVTTNTADPVITLAGDATGSVTLTNLGSGTLTVSVVDDSHNHVVDNVDGLRAELDAKAPLASPALTGVPTAPTAAAGTNTTQIATTAFVANALSGQNDASGISVTPQGNLSSNTVQLALEELQSDINSLLVDTEW